ncbi:MAG: AraC family transcriptional regulator, partial [Bacteroidetes bacterium]
PEIYERILHAKLFMDENFSQPIGLDQISRKAYFSRFHFHRVFTNIYRITPHQYITAKRIEKARSLLAENRLSVTEVCAEVGFESLGSFSILFKKMKGIAPQDFRESAHQNKIKGQIHPRKFIPSCFIDQFKLNGKRE